MNTTVTGMPTSAAQGQAPSYTATTTAAVPAANGNTVNSTASDQAMLASFLKFMAQQVSNNQGTNTQTINVAAPSQLETFVTGLMPDVDALMTTIKAVGDNVAASTFMSEVKKQEEGMKSNVEFLTKNATVTRIVDLLIKVLNSVKANSSLVTEYLAKGMQAVKVLLNSPQFNLPMQMASIFNANELLAAMNSTTTSTATVTPATTVTM